MAIVVALCLCWGFNQVAIKLAIGDVPPLIQCAIRAGGAALIVAGLARLRGIPLTARDGTLTAGLICGLLFGIEFLLIYRGLLYTTASRATLFIYLAPFFVVLGARVFLPGDRFGALQWTGLLLSFAGMVIAFGLPTPAADPRQLIGDLMMIGAAIAWAATTLMIKTSVLNRISPEKTLLYQLAVCVPVVALGALVFGKRLTSMLGTVALGSLAYQVLVVSFTFAAWLALIVRYSANRLSAFTFLTPLCGVAAGHLVLGEPLTPAFALAVVLVAAGLVLVNRPRSGYISAMSNSSVSERHKTVAVSVGGVTVGGGAPVVVQSMTNTDTADVEGTARQVAALARAGSELVRITVDRDEAAAAVPKIKERLAQMNVAVPIVGDFHYIGHKLLAEHPGCAEALDKYRINPGNVGFKDKKDRQFSAIVEMALKHNKPVRIGANWGSLDQELLTHLMDENSRSSTPMEARAVTREALVQSALLSAARAEEIGLPRNRIILSVKVSAVQDLIACYSELVRRSDYAVHLGLTEAGMGSKGIVASAAAMGVLLQQGIGDTVRVSLTPEPNGDRTLEVKVAQELLQTMGLRTFVPLVAACPGCGRTTSTTFQELAQCIQAFIHDSMPEWKKQYPGVEGLNVAVMGCIVNGPGESKHADIGISLPGTGETPTAPVFIDGKKAATLRGPTLSADFKQMVLDYIERRYGQGARAAE